MLTACGESAAPPRFPALSGTFDVAGTFNGLPSSLANFNGTITFSQASRNDSTLTGVANILVTIGSSAITVLQVHNARVRDNGTVLFRLPTENVTSTWAFSGMLSGTAISGTHVLSSPSSSSPTSGPFTATKR